MHSSPLAFEAPFFCALTTFAAALLFSFAWRIGLRPWYVLVGVAGWLCWTVYFSLLAITAGPAPLLNRGDIAPMVRWSELLGGVLIAVWLMFWVRHGTQVPAWNVPDEKLSYPREGARADGG